MTVDEMMKTVTESASKFWLNAGKRWVDARKKTKTEKGYTTDDLTGDLVGSWMEALDAWAGWMSTGTPAAAAASAAIPFFFFEDTAETFKNKQQAKGPPTPVSAAAVSCTELVRVGSPGSNAPTAEAALAGGNLEVTIKFNANNAAEAGFYQGVVYGSPQNAGDYPPVLAQILVHVQPTPKP